MRERGKGTPHIAKQLQQFSAVRPQLGLQSERSGLRPGATIMAASSLNESQQDTLLVVAQVCATFSLLGSLFILLCFARFPHLRKLSFTLVAWLAVADLGEYYGSYLKQQGYIVCK